MSSDNTRLTDVFTYCKNGLRQSWIDHVVCSASLDNLIESMLVMTDIICSDHSSGHFEGERVGTSLPLLRN